MQYSVLATAATPAFVIYVIDVSGSMSQELEGVKKIDVVNGAIKSVLTQMVERSTKGAIISPRYKLSMIAYSTTPINVLNNEVETIDVVARMGTPVLSASSLTNTHDAFVWARNILQNELPKLDGCPAPMVCHLTDGLFTGNDPLPVVREIMQMSNPDGNVLVENIFVGQNLTQSQVSDAEAWEGVTGSHELTNDYAKRLYEMSSPLPESYANVLMEEGYSLKPGVKMLIPATSRELVGLAFAMSGATPTVNA